MKITIKEGQPIASKYELYDNGTSKMYWDDTLSEYLYDDDKEYIMDTPGLYYATEGGETTYYILNENKIVTSFEITTNEKDIDYIDFENVIRDQELENKSWTDIAKYLVDFSGIIVL